MTVDPALAGAQQVELSVMGAVKDEAKRLSGCVAPKIACGFDQFFTSVSELEQRFQLPAAACLPSMGCTTTGPTPAAGASYAESIHLMMDVRSLPFNAGSRASAP